MNSEKENKRTLIEFKELLQFDLTQTQTMIDKFFYDKNIIEIDSPEQLTRLLRKIIKSEYEVLQTVKQGNYELENIFLIINTDTIEQANNYIYELSLYECSCGWDYNIGGDAMNKKTILNTLLNYTLSIYYKEN